MDSWFKASLFVTSAAIALIIAYYQSQRQGNERGYSYENASTERTTDYECNLFYNQRQCSQDSTTEAKLREKLAKLREERKRQLEEQERKQKEEKAERKRKEEEAERKRKREEEETVRKKNEKIKSMLDSFDDIFDNEMGVKTDRVCVDENIDDWSRNAEKQKLKQEFRAKQIAHQQKSQDEKDQMNSNNRIVNLKIEQQKSTVTKCVMDKKFIIQEFLLNTIISVNIENNFTLALSLRRIKKNKRRKIIDLQELESAVFSLQKVLQENESSKTGAIPNNSKKKIKRKKAEAKIAAEKMEEDKLETVKRCENCSSIFEQKQLEDQKRKLELEKKQRERRLVEWELMKQSRQNYQSALTKSTENHSNINTLQKQLEKQNRKVNFEVNRRGEANEMNFKPNFYDDEIVYEDNYYYQNTNQLSELIFKKKSVFTQYHGTEDKKEIINGYVEKDRSKVEKHKSITLKHTFNKQFECPNLKVNTTNNDTIAVSLRDSLQDHTLTENVKEKVKKPKTKEQIAAWKRRKQLRKQKNIMQ